MASENEVKELVGKNPSINDLRNAILALSTAHISMDLIVKDCEKSNPTAKEDWQKPGSSHLLISIEVELSKFI